MTMDSGAGRRFYGKFRGTVQDVNDPLMLGRIKATVPAVLGTNTSGWALPCLPFGGSSMGLSGLPVVGAYVWIEFEQGDPEHPIWSGCFWGSPSEVPATLLTPPYKKTLLQTQGGHYLLLDDSPGNGGITLATASGEKATFTSQGITVQTSGGAKLSLTPQGVTLQTSAGDALTLASDGVTLKTSAGDKVSLAASGSALQTAAGAKVSLAPAGITVDNGQGATIDLQGPSVGINKTALKVI